MTEKSPKYIRANLVNFTNADCSEERVNDNRYYYDLKFEDEIGWDWLYSQISKCSSHIDVQLEPYEISGSGVGEFEVSVRELHRRENIDDDQHSLTEFDV